MFRPTSRLLSFVVGTLALTTSGIAQGTLYTVDDDQPADFSDLQSAVDAAQDGDLFLVRAGSYAGFEIPDRSLVITAEPDADVRIGGGILIESLSASRSIALRGLTVGAATALRVTDAAGAVFAEDCSFYGLEAPLGFRAVSLLRCDAVTFSHCTLSAVGVGHLGPVIDNPGLGSADSVVHLYECQLQGGTGGLRLGGMADDGSPALEVLGGEAFLSGCRLVGGAGGASGAGPMGCTVGGTGGPAVLARPYVNVRSVVRVRDCELRGGSGGAGCPAGPEGPILEITGGEFERLEGSARDFFAPSPAVAGSSRTRRFEGEPGDHVTLLQSSILAPCYHDRPSGTLVPERVSAELSDLGGIDGTGVLEVDSVVPAPVGAFDVSWVQALHVEPGGGAVLGAPRICIGIELSQSP